MTPTPASRRFCDRVGIAHPTTRMSVLASRGPTPRSGAPDAGRKSWVGASDFGRFNKVWLS
jgi:hypothetical protein